MLERDENGKKKKNTENRCVFCSLVLFYKQYKNGENNILLFSK